MKLPRVAVPITAIGWLVMISGCASYEARPLDLAAHQQAFRSRDPGGESVRAFVESLNHGGGDSAAFDPSDGFGLPEVEAVALVFNADLRQARLRAGVSQATADHAGLWSDPVLGADFTKIAASVDHPWKSMVSLGFTLPLSGRLEIEKKRAAAELHAELQRVLLAEWHTRVELRQQWIAWVAASQKCGVMSDFVRRLDDVIGVVTRSEEAGEMPRIEARLFRLERASRALALRQFESQRDASLLQLKQTMGLSPQADVTLTPDGLLPPGLRDEETVRIALQSGACARMEAARAAYDVAERSLQLEVRRQYPDLVLGPGYGREDGHDQVLLGISAPIPLFNRNQQAIAQAEAQRDVARGEFEREYERLSAELATAELELRTAVERRDVLEREIVPMVDEQYADARKVASLGEVNTLVILETITRQQEAKLALIDAAYDEAIARTRLDALAGPPPVPAAVEGGAP